MKTYKITYLPLLFATLPPPFTYLFPYFLVTLSFQIFPLCYLKSRMVLKLFASVSYEVTNLSNSFAVGSCY